MKKKTKKQATKTAKKSNKITKSGHSVIAKKPSIIEPVMEIEIKGKPEPISTTEVIEKVPVEFMMDAFDLFSAMFHPEGFDNSETGEFYVDDRFTALWKTALCVGGWNEDQFWIASDEFHAQDECEDCKKERELRDKKEAETKAKNVN